jgi:hypothetical protein
MTAAFATLDGASPAGRARSSEPSAACRIIRADVPPAPKKELNPAVRDRRRFSHRPHECGAEQVHRTLDPVKVRETSPPLERPIGCSDQHEKLEDIL